MEIKPLKDYLKYDKMNLKTNCGTYILIIYFAYEFPRPISVPRVALLCLNPKH